MTDEEFNEKWSYLSQANKEFVERYLIYFDIDKAYVPLRVECKPEQRKYEARKMWKKTREIIGEIIKRDYIMDDFFCDFSIKNKLEKLYEQSDDEYFKLKVLQEAMKIIGVDNANKVEVKSDNVTIKFSND